jgi:hypothetical protein
MRTRFSFLRIARFALLLFCAGALPLRANATVTEGMTREQVIAAWGKPVGRFVQNEVEVLHYDRDREVHLEDGIAISVLNAATASPFEAYTGTVTDRIADFPSFDTNMTGNIPFDVEPTREMAGIALAVVLAMALLMLAGTWRVYAKAGQPGWACIVPIYQIVVLLQIARKPVWWMLLLFVPVVNIVIVLLIDISLAGQFGKGAGFGLGLFFLPVIFYPVLGFGSAEYQD